MRDKTYSENLWEKNKAPWKLWNEQISKKIKKIVIKKSNITETKILILDSNKAMKNLIETKKTK